MSKRGIAVTIVCVLVLAASGATARWWLPWGWKVAKLNDGGIGLATNLAQWLLWAAAAIMALVELPRRPRRDETPAPPVVQEAGRDFVHAGRDVQTGGIRIEGPARDIAGAGRRPWLAMPRPRLFWLAFVSALAVGTLFSVARTALGSRSSLSRSLELAVGPGGRVYVANYTTRKIQQFTTSGKPVRSWKMSTDTQGVELGCMEVDGEGRVYVAPSATPSARIQIFSANGAPLGGWPFPDSVAPLKLVVARDGSVYALEMRADLRTQMAKFSHEGRLLFRFALPGPEDEEFGPILSVAVDRAGTVYLMKSHGRFDKFSSSGKHLGSWTVPGEVQLHYPVDMKVDPDGNVYVIDGYSIIKFDPNGRLLKRWGPFRWVRLEDLDDSAIVPRIVAPSAKEMYLLFLPRSGSSPVVERRSQKDGRVLARWAVK